MTIMHNSILMLAFEKKSFRSLYAAYIPGKVQDGFLDLRNNSSEKLLAIKTKAGIRLKVDFDKHRSNLFHHRNQVPWTNLSSRILS